VGSLGHSRYVAVSDWRGGQIALEAKAAIPSACVWARRGGSSRIYYQLLLEQAIRCPDPFVRLSGKWLVRQLAPDSSPIEIETMNGQKDQDRLLHAMASPGALGPAADHNAGCAFEFIRSALHWFPSWQKIHANRISMASSIRA
jgi:hypothetical protein